jgi:tripartite-type tricarboxylate transporter receptor subunit TctC
MSTAGAGTAGHFAGETFIAMAGIKPVVVHYIGDGQAIEAVVDNDSTTDYLLGFPHRGLTAGAVHLCR